MYYICSLLFLFFRDLSVSDFLHTKNFKLLFARGWTQGLCMLSIYFAVERYSFLLSLQVILTVCFLSSFLCTEIFNFQIVQSLSLFKFYFCFLTVKGPLLERLLFAYKVQAVFDDLLLVHLSCLGYFGEWSEVYLDNSGWVYLNISSPEHMRDSGGRMDNTPNGGIFETHVLQSNFTV